MSTRPQESSFYAAEIETATISYLWHYPAWCPEFLRDIDPQIHLFQPHLRHIAEAINIAAGELGFADWATVVQVVRELGAFEECGALDGLNSVYDAIIPCAIDGVDRKIFAHYLDMLKRYALAREHNVVLYRFNRGDFVLRPNRLKHGNGAPDFLGSGRFCGRLYQARAYQNSDAIRFSILPP